MADLLNIGGYDCDFVDPVPEDLECSICLLPVRDPEQTRCACAKLYCLSCLSRQKVVTGRCPTCREQLDSFHDGASARRVKRLLVKCSNKSCPWKNELGNLGEHLDKCEYTMIPCTRGCGEDVARGELRAHLEGSCILRQYECPHCSTSGTYRDVTGVHLEECPRVKVTCAKPGCGLMIERRDMESHLYECGKPKLQCEYAIVGCGYVGIEERLKEHMAAAVHSHLALAMEAFKPRHVAPVVLRMQNFDIHGSNKFWTSPPFYSHASGYKLCLRVNPNGYGEGKGTHVSIYVSIMRGENDDSLMWPLRAKFRVALLNQLDDSGHFEKHFVMDSNESKKYNSRVVDVERSPNPWGEPTFMSHEELVDGKYCVNKIAFFQVGVEILPACKPWLMAIN